MSDQKPTDETVKIRLEPTQTDLAVNTYHIGRFDGYRDAVMDLLPIFGAIGLICAAWLIFRHWELT